MTRLINPISGDELVDALNVDEAISLLHCVSVDIPKIGFKRYNLNNECLHGVIRPGDATVFPQAIALAATWNPKLLNEVATAISDEVRAKQHSMDECDLHTYGGCLVFF